MYAPRDGAPDAGTPAAAPLALLAGAPASPARRRRAIRIQSPVGLLDREVSSGGDPGQGRGPHAVGALAATTTVLSDDSASTTTISSAQATLSRPGRSRSLLVPRVMRKPQNAAIRGTRTAVPSTASGASTPSAVRGSAGRGPRGPHGRLRSAAWVTKSPHRRGAVRRRKVEGPCHPRSKTSIRRSSAPSSSSPVGGPARVATTVPVAIPRARSRSPGPPHHEGRAPGVAAQAIGQGPEVVDRASVCSGAGRLGRARPHDRGA